MATEFERTLDKLSHSESETASFWQAKHSALSQHFSRAETELKLLQAELDVRMAEREEMRDALDAMRRDLAAREEEVLSLKGHLAKMKQWISASGKMEDQTSDQEFADMMMKLMNGLQNWVISHFKKARLGRRDYSRHNTKFMEIRMADGPMMCRVEISSTDDDVVGELARLVPMFVQVASQSKLALLQSIVSQIMVELVFQPYFPGLPDDQNRRLRQHEDDLAAMTEAINQWRASTLALIRKHSTEAIRQHSASLLDNSVARLNQILDSITDANTTDMRDQAARALLSNAMELAQSLALQKARFTVKIPSVLPQEHVTYDQSTMEDTGGEDDDDLIGRPVLCIIFPALVKNGDAAGEHLHFENVICKAKVLCTSE
ncbi:uncharacterized protein B0I36DRAFT_5553 [Microdochium trichocladiopsis]|uniref:Uncharacterized protein n=1 Tax=Microdochium trichocladiopsis TaxID=1682393 RepID=A0A9P9BVC2_9PEZI|nr:uncharacterized protein B0I36DRAFT_5553 [Microdochium trichocladiopsis]KAH7040093.1 hypothetical protein B0I36DRAFT_5553 [Microdochium trichocladiopsis]